MGAYGDVDFYIDGGYSVTLTNGIFYFSSTAFLSISLYSFRFFSFIYFFSGNRTHYHDTWRFNVAAKRWVEVNMYNSPTIVAEDPVFSLFVSLYFIYLLRVLSSFSNFIYQISALEVMLILS